MVKVGIIGGAGYTAGELIRILVNHPEVKIKWIHSTSNAGNKITDVHEGLIGETDLFFTDKLSFSSVDVMFSCLGHGGTNKFFEEHKNIPSALKIIDFTQDQRIAAQGNDFIYGLPELNRNVIRRGRHIANPGCFATAIQLALLPLAKAGLLNDDVHINAITGSTGAGQKPTEKTHFSWRNNNISIYKAFEHQHLAEIRQSILSLQPSFDHELDFIPMRGDFPRGIFCSAYIKTDLSEDDAVKLYEAFYTGAAFSFVTDQPIDMKQVVNTNKGLVHVEKHGKNLLITSAIDNLLKGAAGQAVQNMNLVFGLDEKTGLRLKSLAF